MNCNAVPPLARSLICVWIACADKLLTTRIMKKGMRSAISLLMALLLSAGALTACGGDKQNETSDNDSTDSTEASESATVDNTTEINSTTTTEDKTEEETEEGTKKPAAAKPEEKKGCGSIVSVGAVVAIIALGVVCIKKKD